MEAPRKRRPLALGEAPSPNVEKVLEQINFAELKKVYQDIAKRCGVEPEKVEFVEKDRIEHLTPRLAGSHIGLGGGTVSSGRFLPKAIALPEYRIEDAPKAFGALCHEEGHIAVRNTHVDSSKILGKKSRFGHIDISGVQRSTFEQKGTRDVLVRQTGEFLNEAIIDTLGKRAFLEYLRRNPIRYGPALEFQIRPDQYPDFYSQAHEVFDTIVDRISEQCGVPRDVVVDGFIRAGFEGLNFSSDEGYAVLAETMSPLFAELIQGANPQHMWTPSTLLAHAELKRIQWTEKLKEKWMSMLGNGAGPQVST